MGWQIRLGRWLAHLVITNITFGRWAAEVFGTKLCKEASALLRPGSLAGVDTRVAEEPDDDCVELFGECPHSCWVEEVRDAMHGDGGGPVAVGVNHVQQSLGRLSMQEVVVHPEAHHHALIGVGIGACGRYLGSVQPPKRVCAVGLLGDTNVTVRPVRLEIGLVGLVPAHLSDASAQEAIVRVFAIDRWLKSMLQTPIVPALRLTKHELLHSYA
ncbi:hypothetical protein SAMN05216488_0062 [Microbacterium sp. LKL04]|nr:hypothetical protein SAMN05216488_0062 [Microbacterium sp. LKL04]